MGIATSRGARRKKQADWEEMGDGGSAPLPIFSGRRPTGASPRSQVMMVFPCMSQGLVKSGSCRGSMGKRRCPRPINRHASTKAAGFWGPRRSALDHWLRLEAKPERALGPGATVGVLGMGVPRLACLRPTAWLCELAHLHQQAFETLVRGQALRGGRHKTSSGAASLGWLVRGGEIKARQTSRGSRDVSHYDQDQTGASARSVLVSSLVLRRQAQARSTEASGKGFHIGAMRPRPVGWQDRGHHGAQGSVTTRAF